MTSHTIEIADERTSPTARPFLRSRTAVIVAVLGVAAFHLAYEFPALSFLMGVFCFCMIQLGRVRTARGAFYLGLAIGMALYAPQLWFFVGIFKAAAIGLWMICAIWLGLFLVLSRACVNRLPRIAAALAVPVLWTGVEYFRSELYYLKFSWVNIGYAFSHTPTLLCPGMYGVGFILMLAASMLQLFKPRGRNIAGIVSLVLLAALTESARPTRFSPTHSDGPFVVGVQLEFGSSQEVLAVLDEAISRYPQADLFVMSELTFVQPPPPEVAAWCRAHQKYLIAGGVEPGEHRNTAFVLGPSGDVIFTQCKSVPVQFFSDGLPAASQDVWNSPWGKIGICICYDLSYTRVTDRLIAMGAGALIVPTMDLESWGERERELHSRVGPTRAAEYGVPIVRVCSSGISQLIAPNGEVVDHAPFPGQGEMIAGPLPVQPTSRLPIDRVLAMICVAATGLIASGLAFSGFWCRFRATRNDGQSAVINATSSPH
jgi:apolipoprotein N-acyltransferase